MKNKSFIYSAIVLIFTWVVSILMFQNEEFAKKNFAIIMFVPMIVAIIFQRFSRLKLQQGHQIFTFKNVTLKALLLGIFLPFLAVVLIAIIDVLFNISSFNASALNNSEKITALFATFIPAILSVLGEEIGWRGYLLPSLAEQYGKFKATIITGIVWALFHTPLVYMLAKMEHVSNPGLVALVQALTVFVISISFAYIYFLANNLLPVVLFHAIWNEINPFLLGDLYKNEAGVLKGNIFVQNGEGVMGLVVLAIISIFFMLKIKSMKETIGNQSLTI